MIQYHFATVAPNIYIALTIKHMLGFDKMKECLKSLKGAYDILTEEERQLLIKDLKIQMNDLLFRADEKKELLDYLKGAK